MTEQNEHTQITEEQWERIISWQRRQWKNVEGFVVARRFIDSMQRLRTLTGPTDEELEGVKAQLKMMGEKSEE